MARIRVSIPEYHTVARIRATELAAWLDQQADRWWIADGETHLMETLNFPCPGDELASIIRRYGNRQLELLQDIEAPAEVPQIMAAQFEEFANTDNRHYARNFLLRWEGTTRLWLLSEDVPASQSSDEEIESGE